MEDNIVVTVKEQVAIKLIAGFVKEGLTFHAWESDGEFRIKLTGGY